MHMADALLSPAVALTGMAAAAGLVGLAAWKAGREPGHERRVPLMGVLGAFVFAAQMINFTIPGTGSSGHIGGGVLLAVLLGPWASILVMSSVLTVQCLLFADGGLLALGCNILNLALWPALVGLPLHRALGGGAVSRRPPWLPSVLAVVVALQLGAFSVVLETRLSGRSELGFAAFTALMLGIHLPIAIVEGLLTAGVVASVRRLMPDLAEPAPGLRPAGLGLLLAAALLLGGVGAWFASSHPDGLEWSVARLTGTESLAAPADGWHGRAAAAQERTALLPDYGASSGTEPAWPAVDAGTSRAGLVGALVTALTAALVAGLVIILRRKPTAA